MTDGSHLWQLIFVSFAVVLVLFEIVRGWRLGLVRQIVRLIALAAAYLAGVFGGRILLPVLRGVVHAPDLVISIATGAILALLVYALIGGIGALLFKKTGQQNVAAVRLLYGTSGALLGIFFGLFTVWLIVVGIRAIGAVASAEVHETHTPSRRAPGALHHSVAVQNPPPFIDSVAKLKNSLELGSLGEVVKSADVLPQTTYQTLGKMGSIASDPRSAERFLSFPGAQQLTQNPKIIALRDDPEIMNLIEQHRYLDLLQNQKLIDALNDPAIAAQLRRFDFRKALDYALPKPAPND